MYNLSKDNAGMQFGVNQKLESETTFLNLVYFFLLWQNALSYSC